MVTVHMGIEQKRNGFVGQLTNCAFQFFTQPCKLVVYHKDVFTTHINPDISALPGKHINLLAQGVDCYFHFLVLAFDLSRKKLS